MTKKLFGFSLILIFALGSAIAQNSVVDWSYDAKKISGNEYEVTFTAEVQDGWYVYSQFISDDGPIPTSFEFDDAKGISLVGKSIEEGYKKEGYDEVFGMDLIKFGKTVTFTQRIKVQSGIKSLSGYLTYMTCDDEQCLPPTDVEFQISL